MEELNEVITMCKFVMMKIDQAIINSIDEISTKDSEERVRFILEEIKSKLGGKQMHWDDLKDEDLICVSSKDGGYAVNKKADLIKDEIKNKSSFLVKREYVEISIDEMRNIFIKKVFDIFKKREFAFEKNGR